MWIRDVPVAILAPDYLVQIIWSEIFWSSPWYGFWYRFEVAPDFCPNWNLKIRTGRIFWSGPLKNFRKIQDPDRTKNRQKSGPDFGSYFWKIHDQWPDHPWFNILEIRTEIQTGPNHEEFLVQSGVFDCGNPDRISGRIKFRIKIQTTDKKFRTNNNLGPKNPDLGANPDRSMNRSQFLVFRLRFVFRDFF